MFISPKNDFCMKELFCNELVRRYFISDVLDIPVAQIRSVRLANAFLRRQYRYQKQGILDVRLEMNDDTRMNIELQVKKVKFWDCRQMFYACKLFTEDMVEGEEYGKLKRCISISVLDFNLDEGEQYHNVYQMRNSDGHVFCDRLEIHTIELRKKLRGVESIDDWIRLFNAESERDLDMIQTKNLGILEAIKELKTMSLTKRLRMQHEFNQKCKWDAQAREAYVRDEGIEIGREAGMQQGMRIEREQNIRKSMKMLRNMGISEQEIVQRISDAYELAPDEVEAYMNKI